MKIYESISRKELEERFKPLKATFSPWPFAVTSIKGIKRRETTQTGQVNYIVEFKDGQTRQIPAKSLNVTKKKLVEDFELQHFRDSQQPVTRKRATNSFKPRIDAKKKARLRGRIGSNDDSAPASVPSSDNSDNEEDDTRAVSATRSGRKSTQSKTYQTEFYAGKLGEKKRNTQIVHVPIPEDPDFIAHHSELCYRCNESGNHKGPIDVPVGTDARKQRLLLCKSCSYSIHNNCLPQFIGPYFENGQMTCVKCQRKNSCVECHKTIPEKNDTKLAFRCNFCFRGFHNKCIKKGVSSDLVEETKDTDPEAIYANGICFECAKFGQKHGSIVAERTVNNKTEFLIKWKNVSYRHTNWVLESWMQGAQSTAYRAYIKKRSEQDFVTQNGIPIEWKTVDRILNVEWLNKSKLKAKRILAVYKDTSYEDAVWDDPPTEDETEFYPDYEIALKRYILASKVKPPIGVRQLISDVRKSAKTESYEKHEIKSQPGFITGGTLMKHQLEALNWLLYQWENKQSCILADDMGLGKTIQIIGYLYTLYKKFNIYPFVIVVPNSTATNWIREFNKWAPEMVVAPFFGGQTGRTLAMDNEIFDNRINIKCHVVVTTYESSMESTRLQNIFWAVMVVDESQRLKNDQSSLFKTLKNYKVDQITLLTGTPLQNNLRELFNIMNFIQPKDFHGSEAAGYDDMTKLKVDELHSRLRPHFLRRTKEEVLKTLPPKYELIVPLSMTPLQKEVYKQCLSREIYETLNLATGSKIQRGLSSIFMNLRKVLNHPYLLDGVETSHPTPEETQSAMINACGKLMLFHQMFPKLKAAGHRILLFSTMTRVLDVLEDYMTFENIGYVRLDGSCNERSRVRSIDAFNAPGSKIDVFLLSTRAGGVGINLTTADTVIIWDSDFNPYADLQAISRAHRIGQTNMVLILRLMTRLTVEEKVLQIGKKKMALEHVVVERMKENEEDKIEDIESILKFGAEALFADDDSTDVQYDSAALDKLLDRERYREAAIENQKEEIRAAEEGKTKEAEQGVNFSFAKVWKVDGSVEELPSDEDGNQKDDTSSDFWQKFLKEKEIEAERKREEKRLAAENLGRGARKRAVVTYSETKESMPTKDKGSTILDPEFNFEENEKTDEELENLGQKAIEQPKQRLSTKEIAPRPVIMHAEQSSFQNIHNMQPIQLNRPYQENLYTDMFNESLPFFNRMKNIASKAFYDNVHLTEAYHNGTKVLYNELDKAIDDRFIERDFVVQFRAGLARNIDQTVLQGIFRSQIALLQELKHRLNVFIRGEMEMHFNNLYASRKRIPTTQHRDNRLSGEDDRRRREAEQKTSEAVLSNQQGRGNAIDNQMHFGLVPIQKKPAHQPVPHQQHAELLARQQVQQIAYAQNYAQNEAQQRVLVQQAAQQAAAQQQHAAQQHAAQKYAAQQYAAQQQAAQQQAAQQQAAQQQAAQQQAAQQQAAQQQAAQQQAAQQQAAQQQAAQQQAAKQQAAQQHAAQQHAAHLQAAQQQYVAQQETRAKEEQQQQLLERQKSIAMQQTQKQVFENEPKKQMPEASLQSQSSAPVQPLTQLTPEMALELQNYLIQHQGQQVNLQDFFSSMSKKSKEEEKLKEAAAAAAAAAAVAEQHRQAEEALKEKLRVDALTRSDMISTSNIHLNSQNSSPRPPYEGMNPPPDPYHVNIMGIETLSRKNAEYFQNVSPEIKRSLFNAPPPVPDKHAVDNFEKTASVSPSIVSPSTLSPTQIERNYQEAIRKLQNTNPNNQ
ncbi:hypothetical protein INT47_013075 [Mucor saturninus]|uniref:Uncharacterized protein n=1 Tax=Mucor saturninus TaxID=64648 RepID=A0A8H7R0Z0_9FUNG|nr:hypothetical protein INT47_013075 [Mucor saturninus]